MNRTNVSVFGDLTKAEQQDDGTLRVEGIASSEVVDSAGEIIKASAMKAAIPSFMNGGKGSLRLMHRSDVAAGTVDSVEVDEISGETKVCCTVVDPAVVRLVLTKTLRGMSVGGKVTGRDPKDSKIITGVDWRELSLCDRPANPSCSMMIAKAATAAPINAEPLAPDAMEVVEDVGRLSQEQVAAYLASLTNEDRAALIIRAVMRTRTGRKF